MHKQKLKLTIISLLLTILLSAGTASADLVGYWSFDDQTDPTTDSTVNGNDAVLGFGVGEDDNDPAFNCDPADIAPALGNVCSLEFIGNNDPDNDDFATIPNDAVLDVTDAYTLSAWVKVSDVATYRPILVRGADNGSDANDIEVYVQAGTEDLIVAHKQVWSSAW